MYRMKEFSAMTGLSQSKIRFYEKQGLVLSNRLENGYWVFTREDAFRSNAFRMLLQYGFSIEEAVILLDAKQGSDEFRQLLLIHKEKLQHEADSIAHRLKRIETALNLLQLKPESEFELINANDQLYINASYGKDFSVSLDNEQTICEYYSLMSFTNCARIIEKDDLLDSNDTVDPNYILTVAECEKHRLSEKSLKQVKRLSLGRCLRFKRQASRAESVRKESFNILFDYLDKHGHEIRSDIVLFPSFFNIDGQGSDIEILYVPIS